MVLHMPSPAPDPDPSGIVIVGAGGHGRELHWALSAALEAGSSAARIVGFVDDQRPVDGLLERIGSAWLGQIDALADHAGRWVLGIGAPGSRARVFERVDGVGDGPIDVIHPSVLVGPDVLWGDGFVACANVSITTHVRFGMHVHCNRHVTIGHDCVVGDFVSLHPAAVLSGNVTVGERTMIGAGAVVLPGVTIGRDVQVGAGAVVTRAVPDGATVVGSPARSVSQR